MFMRQHPVSLGDRPCLTLLDLQHLGPRKVTHRVGDKAYFVSPLAGP